MKNSTPCFLFVGERPFLLLKFYRFFKRFFVSTMKTVSFVFEKQEEIRRSDNLISSLQRLLTLSSTRNYITIHCKKRLPFFPSPAGMSLTKLSLARNNLIIPGQGEIG
jgi:hypothetical protein